MKKLIPALLLLCAAMGVLGQTVIRYPGQPTIPPVIGPGTILCNNTLSIAAPIQCTFIALSEGPSDSSTITRTASIAGDAQLLKITNTFSATPGTGTGASIASMTINTTLGPITGAANFNDFVTGLSTNLTVSSNTNGAGVNNQAFIAKAQKNSCYPATSCTKIYSEDLVLNDYTGLPTSGTYSSGGSEESEFDFRGNDTDTAGSSAGLIPSGVGIRTPSQIVLKSYIPFTPSTPLTITGASGDGTTATLTFASQSIYFQPGDNLIVASMVPAGYNGTFVVTASSATSVSYLNSTTGFTSGGTANLPATTVAWGYRVDGQTNDTIYVNRAFAVNNLTIMGAGHTTEFATLGTNASAYRMAGGQNLGWDIDSGSGATAYAKHQTFYDETNSWLAYQVAGTEKFMVDDTGKSYASGMYGLGANPLTLGTQTYGVSATIGACGSVACANSVLISGAGSGVAPAIKTVVTGTGQADLNLQITPASAATSSGLNGGNVVLQGSAGDGAGTRGLVTVQDSINGNTKIGTGTSTGTTIIGNTAATGSALTINAPTSFSFGTSISQATWLGVSPIWNAASTTLNDTTASGTVSLDAAYSLQAPIFTSTGGASTTITNPTTLWVGVPTCSGGVNCTTPLSAFFNGAVKFNSSITVASGGTINGALSINTNNNAGINLGTGTDNVGVVIGGGSNTVTLNATTLSLTGTLSGTSISNYLAAPPAIGGTTPNTGAFTTLSGTSGTHTGVTGFGLRDTSAAFDVTLAATSSTALNAGRTLTLDMKNVAHTLAFNSTANTITFPNTASYTLIGSGDTGTVTNTMLAGGITLANHASQAANTVVGNATSGSASPTALAVGSCSTAGSALQWTTNTGFGCNTAITAATSTGVTSGSGAAAGVVGEVASIHCIVGTQAQAATTITVTIASPAVVTWTSHTFVPSSGLANYTCPINFTNSGGALPTGITVGTNYYIDGSSVSGDTFEISDTASHALAGTNHVNTSGSQSGTQSAYIGNLTTTGNVFNGAGLQLVAGDWDCTDLGEFQELTTLTSQRYATGINTVGGAFGSIGTFTDNPTVSGAVGAKNTYLPSPVVQENVSGTTTIIAITSASYTVGTMNQGAFLRCRRMR
jgi:hypothetical protein